MSRSISESAGDEACVVSVVAAATTARGSPATAIRR